MPKLIPNKLLIKNAYNNRHTLGVSIHTLSLIFNIDPKTINNYKNTDDNDLIQPIKRISFMYLLSDDIINYILDDAVNNPYFNVHKTRRYIKKTFNYTLTSHQIYCILKFNNITYKKVSIKNNYNKKTDQQNNILINETINKVNNINNIDSKDDIIFTDEVHIDISETKNYGWNKKGDKVNFKNNIPNKIMNKRITVIASVSRSKKIGYKIYHDTVNGEKFNGYINYINKKSKIKNYFMDNARIHHYNKVKTNLKNKNKNVIYGVPYQPQLNIIENFFRSFKTKIKNELLEKRTNIKYFIRKTVFRLFNPSFAGKCWNNVSTDVLKNTYNHVYIKNVFN